MSKTNTEEHILDTAIELFWAKSYHGVNMNALSRAANVNKATLYQYFASKEDLVIAAIKRAIGRSEQYVYRAAFEETNDPRLRIEQIYERAHAIHRSLFEAGEKCRGCPFVNLGVELATSSENVRDAVNGAFVTFQSYFAAIVEGHFKDNDGLTNVSKSELAATLMANMNSCLVESKMENNPDAILRGKARALRILAM